MTLGRSLKITTMIPTQDIPGLLSAVARGADSAFHLSREAARALFAKWLSGQLPSTAQGALWIAFRLKGETLPELLGFVAATEGCLATIKAPAGPKPVVLPSYNGARRHANLLPLLALLLAREGVPVLIHGSYGGPAEETALALPQHDPSARTSTGEILAHLGYPPVITHHALHDHLQRHRLAYVPLDVLHLRLASMLSLRRVLGVRSSAHTVIKLFNPFKTSVMQCAAVTHPAYLDRMRAFFMAAGSTALVFRGAEGEPVAHARRRPALIGIDAGYEHEWFREDRSPLTHITELPDECNAATTCVFIGEILAGHRAIPEPIRDQAACLLVMSGAVPDLASACAKLNVSSKRVGQRS